MADVIVSGSVTEQVAFKQITFTGAASLGAIGNLPLFTTTGAVLVRQVVGFVGTSLTGATATIALGVTGSTSLFVAATVATTMTSTNNIWLSSTATAAGLALPALASNIVVTANIVGTVAVAAVATGVLTVAVVYVPLSAGANLA